MEFFQNRMYSLCEVYRTNTEGFVANFHNQEI